MKLGFGLYKTGLTPDNFRFARQLGATHVVAHLVDYNFKGYKIASKSGLAGWGHAWEQNKVWSVEELLDLKKALREEGLELEAIENFSPAHWHDILLDGPKKKAQMETIKTIIRNVGKAGIPCIGYNFSIAGVWGWVKGPFARGGAVTVGFEQEQCQIDTPIPKGMVWNMIYDPEAGPGELAPISHEELWRRFSEFLKEIIPVAEESKVMMALHPDDPPMDQLRGTARLVNQPYKYQRVMEIAPNPYNGIELCMGTVQEMSEGSVYEVLDTYSREKKIGYIHFRNVRGKVPHYHEVFVDEGDIDMLQALRILKKNQYDGVLIPDHTPEVLCDAPWHAGMAFAMGYMRAALQFLEREG